MPKRMLSLAPSPSPVNGLGILVPSNAEVDGAVVSSPERPGSADPHQSGTGVVPCANFFPKAGGVRPKSRSFRASTPVKSRSNQRGLDRVRTKKNCCTDVNVCK
jgi:hypothetical protein